MKINIMHIILIGVFNFIGLYVAAQSSTFNSIPQAKITLSSIEAPVNRYNEAGKKIGLWIERDSTVFDDAIGTSFYINGRKEGIERVYRTHINYSNADTTYAWFIIGQYHENEPYGTWAYFFEDQSLSIVFSNVGSNNDYTKLSNQYLKQFSDFNSTYKSYVTHYTDSEYFECRNYEFAGEKIWMEGVVILLPWDDWPNFFYNTTDDCLEISPFIVYKYDGDRRYNYLTIRQYKDYKYEIDESTPFDSLIRIPLNDTTTRLVQAVLRKNK